MAKYLATFSDILNDIEIKGFVTMSEKDMEHFEELATSITWSFKFDIGDDQELFFESGEDLLTRIEYKEITNEEYKIIKKVFNNEFGVFINEEFLESIANEDEEHDEIFDDFEDNDFIDRRSGDKYDDDLDDDY